MRWGFLYVVWPSVLGLNSLEIHKTKAVKNICMQEKFVYKKIFGSFFILGLGLTCFWTTWPCLQQQKQHLVSSPFSKTCDLNEFSTWALYDHVIGQWILCFDRCQLTKEGCYKPRLFVSVILAGVWPPSCDIVIAVVLCTHPRMTIYLTSLLEY